MELQRINFTTPDEDTIFRYRLSLLETFLSGETDQSISILNLPSLKRGTFYPSPTTKLDSILCDKQRLRSWIQHYKNTSENDPVKIKTFLEAGTRLKMMLDHNDFDEGHFRNKRREAILEINGMLEDIHELKSF